MLINQSEAARRLGISRQAVNSWRNENPLPGFFVSNGGKFFIDDEHPEWKRREQELLTTTVSRESRKRTNGIKKGNGIDREKINTELEEKLAGMDSLNLTALSITAEKKKIIFDAKIKEEQSKQQEIKTLEKKKELAPISLIIYYFSFAENMIQRIYRRPHEIAPQLKAFFLSGEDKKAIQFMVRELESIVKDNIQELKQAIHDEGYRVKELKKKK